MPDTNPKDIQTLRQESGVKIAKREYDVFLSYNRKDRERVIAIGEQLKDLGVAPWLDEWDMRPGLPWKSAMEEDVPHIKSAAICIGEVGLGRWQRREIDIFLDEFVERGCPVIPCCSPTPLKHPKSPSFSEQ